MHICTITITADPNTASPNRCKHKMALYRMRDHHQWLAQRAWQEAGCPISYEPVRVRITVCRGRVMDGDNLLAGMKGLIDGLFKDAITPDDSAQWVSYEPIQQQSGKQFKAEPQVIVRVETMEESHG